MISRGAQFREPLEPKDILRKISKLYARLQVLEARRRESVTQDEETEGMETLSPFHLDKDISSTKSDA